MTCRITDELLLSRSEHHDDGLANLEEISLHQQHLGRLEYVNRVCANLKILLLQDNCIGKIENLGRLRSLEYLNLAMNNVERIENLECCESLRKLDLTLNFIGDITSVQELSKNILLEELMLMGNPCHRYTGYRDFVISCLPSLRVLDGEDISKSERIKAMQRGPEVLPEVLAQQEEYFLVRQREKAEAEAEIEEKKKEYEDPSVDEDECRSRFYKSSSKHTPEFRMEASRKIKEYSDAHERSRDPFRDEEDERRKKKEANRRLFDDSGKPLNVNQAGIEFKYDDSDDRVLVVEIFVFKHLDTSLIELDVQPTYLRATIKGRLFQLRFLEDIRCDQAKAERSKTTGHLLVTMPKVNQPPPRPTITQEQPKPEAVRNKLQKLEVEDKNAGLDFGRIVSSSSGLRKCVRVDEEEVPPLEIIS